VPVKSLFSVGITDVVPVDGSGFFVRLSCRKNFNYKTAGRKRTPRGVQKETLVSKYICHSLM